MSWFDFLKHPFQYEPEIPEDYTEHGVEKGARIEDAKVNNPDMIRIFEATKPLPLNEALAWIDDHKHEYAFSTVIVDTNNGEDLLALRDRYPQVIIQRRSLNTIRHLNTLLNDANETLAQGGYLWCHSRTAMLKKAVIYQRYPKGICNLAYLLHFVWHRMCPKLKPTRWFYMWVTKGTNRTYHRVEVLGRMYRAGFEVIDEGFRHGEFFVLARKAKSPIWDDEPTGSPLIKLRRVGKDGKLIGVYKFRTMYSYSEYLQPYIYEHNDLQEGGKFADDYRITPYGKLMRKLWLDEFPMIFNILKLDMKLVGVRPLSRHYFSLYSPEMQALRTKVKPGLLPPFYYDRKSPETIEEVQESEKRYIERYLERPFSTDWRYFWGTVTNILFRGKRSK